MQFGNTYEICIPFVSHQKETLFDEKKKGVCISFFFFNCNVFENGYIYVCIYIYMIYIYMYVYIYDIYIYVCIYIYMIYIYMYVYMYMCVYIYIYVPIRLTALGKRVSNVKKSMC